MAFHLISSDCRDVTTSVYFDVVALLPIATTILSHEFDKEHNKLMHLSSSEILISTNNH
jgi:hypothetical protein